MSNVAFQDETAIELAREFGELSNNRGPFETQWMEAAKRVWPAVSSTFNINGFITPGQKLTEELYDSTAAIGLDRFSAILDSLLTPRNSTWHHVEPSDPTLKKNRQARLYFDEVNRLLFKYRYAPKANFASQNQLVFKSLGAFGTGAMFVDRLQYQREKGLRYKNIPIRNLFFKENHQGIIDTVYRYMPMTARQAVQKWSDAKKFPKFPEDIKTQAAKQPDKICRFVHVVKPREDWDPDRLDAKGMFFGSYYVSLDYKVTVEEKGYNTFPYPVSRYEQTPGEVYGRGPVTNLLPSIKTANEQKKTILVQGQRATAPVLLGYDDGVLDTFDLTPGAYNAGGVTSDGRPLVHALPVGNLAVGKELIDDERQVINDGLLITLFQILVQNPQMTATEVMERIKEKGILLAPTIGRQTTEYLDPQIEREIDVLSQQGLLPALPPILQEARGEYTIQYDSPLTRIQQAEEAAGLMRTVETTLSVVNVTQNPEPLDFFNWDIIVPEIADIHAVPVRWMRSLEQVQQIRMAREKQMQQQQQIQAAPAAAAMVKAQAAAQKQGA